MTPVALASLMMIASGVIHAVVNAIIKGGRDKMAGRAATDGTAALVMVPAVALVPLPHGAWLWLAGSGIVHLVYLIALVRSYQLADLSSVYPVLRGTAPLVTAIITLGLLGEPASAHQVGGIILLGFGMFVLAVGRHLTRKALGWAVLTGLCIAAYTVIDARGVRASPSVAGYIAWDFLIMGVLIVGYFAIRTRGTVFPAMRDQWLPCAVAGLLSICTYGMALVALSLGPTAQLAALRETGMVTAVILSIVFLKERVTPARMAGILCIMGGAILILLR
jgi:drug/metabolite transporter (DMT)-like permease